MKMYNHFATVYDELTENVSYSERTEYISGFFHKYGIMPGSALLDLACGTGSFSEEFLKRGYNVTGVDLSNEMLTEAQRKCAGKANFICANMCEFTFKNHFDACVCCLDSLNHLENIEKVKKAIECVYNSLRQGGVFVFDVNTAYKHKNILGNNTFIFDEEDFFLSWDNEYLNNGKVRLILDMFFAQGDLYQRYTEDFCEQAYDIDALKTALNPFFDVVGVYDDLSAEAPKTNSERLYFICVRKKNNE